MFIATDESAWGVALGDHIFGGRCVFLEMVGLPVRFQGGGVIVDLEYEYVVRVLLRDRDIELATPRFGLHGRRAVLLERGQVIVDLARYDVDIDRVDVKRRGLRQRLVVAQWQQDACSDGKYESGTNDGD